MKLNIKCIVIMSSVLVTAPISNAWDASENQIWLDGSVSGKLADKLSLKLTEQVRYKDEGDTYYFRYTDIAVGYAFAKNWSIDPAFRYFSVADAKGVWSNKNMYHLNLNNTLPLKVVDFKTRLRFTYTESIGTDSRTDVWPEFTLTPSKGFTDWKFKPFVTDEIMYNLNENHLYRNRLSTGLMFSPAKALSLKAFIMQEITEKTKNSGFHENFNYGLFAGYKF